MLDTQEIVLPTAGQESVWDYPRPPRLERSTKHVQVVVGGKAIVDSIRAWRVLETSHPPVYYIPSEDVRMDLLRPAAGNSWCEWKGKARYYDMVFGDLVFGDLLIPHAAWSYPSPSRAFSDIKDHIAFYPSKMEYCSLDGEQVVAQEGDFYGGWITSDLVGPFKGAPGTRGW